MPSWIAGLFGHASKPLFGQNYPKEPILKVLFSRKAKLPNRPMLSFFEKKSISGHILASKDSEFTENTLL